MWYLEECGVVLWRGWCVNLKRVVWYFEEGGMVPWRGGVVLLRGCVVLWRGWCGTLKRWKIPKNLWSLLSIFQIVFRGGTRALIRWTFFDLTRLLTQSYVLDHSGLAMYPGYIPPRALSSSMNLPFMVPNSTYVHGTGNFKTCATSHVGISNQIRREAQKIDFLSPWF